jgi:hypothetical protein
MRKEVVLLTTIIGALFGFLLPSGFTILGDAIVNSNGSVDSFVGLLVLTPVIILVEIFSTLIFGLFGFVIGMLIELFSDLGSMTGNI